MVDAEFRTETVNTGSSGYIHEKKLSPPMDYNQKINKNHYRYMALSPKVKFVRKNELLVIIPTLKNLVIEQFNDDSSKIKRKAYDPRVTNDIFEYLFLRAISRILQIIVDQGFSE